MSTRNTLHIFTVALGDLNSDDIRRRGLAPWVYWLERQAGNPSPRFATDFAFAEITYRHRLSMALPLLRRWREAGIPVVVFKGIALAHSVYPSLALRPFHDVDVVIPEAFTDRALALSQEWARRKGSIGYTLVHPSGSGNIDVHHVLTPLAASKACWTCVGGNGSPTPHWLSSSRWLASASHRQQAMRSFASVQDSLRSGMPPGSPFRF